jgi:hypothetical protein
MGLKLHPNFESLRLKFGKIGFFPRRNYRIRDTWGPNLNKNEVNMHVIVKAGSSYALSGISFLVFHHRGYSFYGKRQVNLEA